MTSDGSAAGIDQSQRTSSFDQFRQQVTYHLMDRLRPDPEASTDGVDHQPRQVFSGHYVPVAPTPLADPAYVSHSESFFSELGLAGDLVDDDGFQHLFSGDLSRVTLPLRPYGWATGYALSIYGTEYTQQCPFRTGNGYGDGRAISICEFEHEGKHWEMQLKGAGRTPYCRGGDGRAVLRSSVREFLAQEFMHAAGVPTSRSLTLFTSTSETTMRPWYSEGSESFEPDIMVQTPVAISTRVAPSFLRVGQIELFARRTRRESSPQAREELVEIVQWAIEREYAQEIDQHLPLTDQVLAFITAFRSRLIALVANWMRVGYCQGNFNSDNCAISGFTLDYGPFGFCETFDRKFQPWTGGGEHFSFFNQGMAAEANFHMLWSALSLLIPEDEAVRNAFIRIRQDFQPLMTEAINQTWADKLGLRQAEPELADQLFELLESSKADFTIFFRELSNLPDTVTPLFASFADQPAADLAERWERWFSAWEAAIRAQHDGQGDGLSERMQAVNLTFTWREWLIAPAYQAAESGDYDPVRQLQHILNDPYATEAHDQADIFYRMKPRQFANCGGISHYSCSS
jgi:uncharacterized protein YdiU (UPF0061 family)